MSDRPDIAAERSGAPRLSTLNRYLPIWVGLAMVAGLGLGRALPDLNDWLDRFTIGTVSVPIAIGLLAMMYPVLAKVRYRRIGEQLGDHRTLGLSLVMNWIAGPALLFTLAWDVSRRPARASHRPDHRGPGPLHRHGAHLERPGVRQ